TQGGSTRRPVMTQRATVGIQDDAYHARRDEIMSLDYQQCFFTGWGDKADDDMAKLKTPALGLTWANQLTTRIVLKVVHKHAESATGNLFSDTERRRYLSVVFSPLAEGGRRSVRYEIAAQGPVAVVEKGKVDQERDWDFLFDEKVLEEEDRVRQEEIEKETEARQAQVIAERKAEEAKTSQQKEMSEMLDPKYWGGDENDEFA
ncbi:DNA repair protein rhp57, partial [Elasticomyces elasticus]